MNDLASILAGGPLARFLEQPPTPEQVREAEEAQRRAEADARADRIALLKDIGIPDKHAKILAAGVYDRTVAAQYAARFLAGTKLALALVGPHDAGKTFACGIAMAYTTDRWLASVKRGPAPCMVAAEHLHKAWLYRDAGREKTTRANPDILLHCPLLVIDDLGQEPDGVAHITMEALDTLIRTRCDEGLRTMITSNLADLPAFLGHIKERGQREQRVGERLTEYGVLKVCPVEGYRRRARGEEGNAT